MTSQAAYGRAHAAITRIVGDRTTDASDAASEILATLGRLGWRWLPQVARDAEPGQPAPPPSDWAEQRRQALEVAAQHTESVREAEK